VAPAGATLQPMVSPFQEFRGPTSVSLTMGWVRKTNPDTYLSGGDSARRGQYTETVTKRRGFGLKRTNIKGLANDLTLSQCSERS
jgi:hypothetical protein